MQIPLKKILLLKKQSKITTTLFGKRQKIFLPPHPPSTKLLPQKARTVLPVPAPVTAVATEAAQARAPAAAAAEAMEAGTVLAQAAAMEKVPALRRHRLCRRVLLKATSHLIHLPSAMQALKVR